MPKFKIHAHGVLIQFFLFKIVIPSLALQQCLDAGYYYSAPTQTCLQCQQGYYCPQGINASLPCPPGQFQSLIQQSVCLSCPANYQCPASATVSPTPCSEGVVAPEGSIACPASCNYESYYTNSNGKCTRRTVPACNLNTQYELPTPFNQTQERICMPLTPCNTVRKQLPESPIQGVM